MTYTLYGSQTSPFVRRLRMLLEFTPYEFRELAIFEKEDAALLNKINPLNQIPVLKHGEVVVWDSRQIFQYLNSIHHFSHMNWQDENTLTAIEGAMDSAVTLLLMNRSGMNVDDDKMYINRQKQRIESVLDYLEGYLTGTGLMEWNFKTISLYCFLDWANYRKLIKLDGRKSCLNFLKVHGERPITQATRIPEGK